MRVVEVTKTCEACPAQWEGVTDDGRSVYVRYRHGYLLVTASAPGGSMDEAIDGGVIFAMPFGAPHGGTMSAETLALCSEGVITWPEGFAS